MVVAVAAVGLCLEWLLLVSGFGRLDFVIRPVESVRHCFEGAFAGLQYYFVAELVAQHCSGPSESGADQHCSGPLESGAVRQHSVQQESVAVQNFEAELVVAGRHCFEP